MFKLLKIVSGVALILFGVAMILQFISGVRTGEYPPHAFVLLGAICVAGVGPIVCGLALCYPRVFRFGALSKIAMVAIGVCLIGAGIVVCLGTLLNVINGTSNYSAIANIVGASLAGVLPILVGGLLCRYALIRNALNATLDRVTETS